MNDSSALRIISKKKLKLDKELNKTVLQTEDGEPVCPCLLFDQCL